MILRVYPTQLLSILHTPDGDSNGRGHIFLLPVPAPQPVGGHRGGSRELVQEEETCLLPPLPQPVLAPCPTAPCSPQLEWVRSSLKATPMHQAGTEVGPPFLCLLPAQEFQLQGPAVWVAGFDKGQWQQHQKRGVTALLHTPACAPVLFSIFISIPL